MKNSRWSRLTAWLVMLVMVLTFSVLTAVSLAEEGTEEVIPPAEETQKDTVSDTVISSIVLSAPLEELEDVTANADFSFVGADGKTVSSPADMDPNQDNTMRISITGLSTEEDPTKKTVLGVTLPENIQLTSAGVSTIGGEVTGSLGENGMLELRWIGDKAENVTVELPVIPHLPTDNDLSGTYALGTAGNNNYKVLLTDSPFMDGNRARLRGAAFQEENGRIITAYRGDDPLWKVTHVSGDYYTVYAVNAGQYMRIIPSTNGLDLVYADQDTAQKIRFTDMGGGYYAMSYGGKALNNSSFNADKGFATYADSDKGNNAILKLYPASALSHDPTVDMSGTWAIVNAKNNSALSADVADSGALVAVKMESQSGVLFPQGDVTFWTFEHMDRDWYTIQTNGGYLNITQSGVAVTGTPQDILVRKGDGFTTVVLATGDSTNDYMLWLSGGQFKAVKNKIDNDTKVALKTSSEFGAAANLVFDVNGGSAVRLPAIISGEPGASITLPGMDASKSGGEFIGWCAEKNFYSKVAGTNITYRKLLRPGDPYTLSTGIQTLYAVYNTTSKNVQFGIRVDGVIQDEPNSYSTSAYKGHFWMENVRIANTWVVDTNPRKSVNGYYLENDVTAALSQVPSAEQIRQALLNEGNIPFDPETQYIHWYVLKLAGNDWHIDGVIRNKDSVEITYDTNVANVVEKMAIKDMPGGYQVAVGTEILIGSNKKSEQVMIPIREGYVFQGWNTKADGSGTSYNGGAYLRLSQNLHLYAQWAESGEGKLVIMVESDWPVGKPAYAGTIITLSARLTGFEKKDYTLQWQYSPDNRETWVDIPGANGMTYTYEMSESVADYIWRVVARDVRNKE